VALDMLTSLESVQLLINAGETSERAIVHAVQTAAGTLEPTMSIVADVSLALRLSADVAPDTELYGHDLGQRRKALLRNWDRLHELRSAPPGKAPSPRALRLEVESEALAALAAVLTAKARPAEPAGATAERMGPWIREFQPGTPAVGQAAPTLLQIFGNVAAKLRDCLVRDVNGRPVGWPRYLGDRSGEATPTSTAYGIKAMLLLEDGLAADLLPVAESLRKMALPRGGYAGREQSGPRPEATAAVLNALRRIASTEDFGMHVAHLKNGLGDFEKSRPFILTTVLETSLLLEPDGGLVETLVDSLLAARQPYGGLLLWPEKAEASLIVPNPSVAHTARAVRVLASVQAVRPSDPVLRALEQGTAWLTEQHDLQNAYEVVERSVDGGLEPVHVRTFTAAWVVKALVSAGVPTTHPVVSNALAQIWKSYGGETAALWAWGNGDLPVWMTFDAVEALRLANLAIPARPGWPPPS
jgi:hypothetical protein